MKIGIIGGGAMGGALALGLINSKKVDATEITVSDPVAKSLTRLSDNGINVIESNTEVVKDKDLVVIAVKPWLVKEVTEEILPYLSTPNTEICFIVAGIPAMDIYKMFSGELPKSISIMIPNTAMALGKSMSFMVTVTGRPELAPKIFGYVGKVFETEERLLPAATALASCGIAYAMRYIRAASEGGVELGFKASVAQDIIAQTLEGAIALLSQPGAHPEIEIDKVTTPGGITIRGLNAMEKAGFTNAVIEGLRASVPPKFT